MFAAIDNWVIPLLFAGAALLRLLLKAASSKTSPSTKDASTVPKPDQIEQPQAASTDEDQIRKFLEALGQPRTAKPPPPLPPRIDVVPRPLAPVRPPQTMLPVPKLQTRKSSGERGRRPAPQRRETMPAPPKRTYEPTRTSVQRTSTPTFEVRDTSSPLPEIRRTAKAPVETASELARAGEPQELDLTRLLRTPSGLRQAIILREIFGTPRSLQSLDDLPGTA